MKNKYWIFASITVLLWGFASVLIRLTFDYFTAVTLGAARIWIAAATLLIICLIKKMPPPRPRDIPVFFAAGAVGFAFYLVFFNLGFARVTAATGNVALAATSLFSALLAVAVFKEKIRPLGWLFSGVSFIGLMILVFWNGLLSVNVGVLYTLFAAFLLSIYGLIQRWLTKRYKALQSSAYSLAAAAILMTPMLPSTIRDISAAPPTAIAVLIYLGMGASGISYLCWSKAFAIAKRTADVSNFNYLPPFIAGFAAYAIFREAPDLGTYIGGAVILFGLWMFQKKA